MIYKLNQCIVLGVFNPRILLEGLISSEIDTLALRSGDEIIWKEDFKNKEVKANYFLISQSVPKSFNLRLTGQLGEKHIEILKIYTHIGIRVFNKFHISFQNGKKNHIQKKVNYEKKPDCNTYDPLDKKEYNLWLENKSMQNEKKGDFKCYPLISVVIPVYNIKKVYLSDCIDSILNQTYQNFEICIADDGSSMKETIETLQYFEKKDIRIKVCYRKNNGHIVAATNSALKLAAGDFVGFVDNDDILDKYALEEIVRVWNENKNIDFIYTDEDKISIDGSRIEPHFKPDFSIDNLLTVNYICHFSVLRKTLLDEIGWLREGYEGAQDYDLFLRAIEKSKKIYHIPRILYHWRQIPGSTALDGSSKSYAIQAGKKALQEYICRNDMKASVSVVENKISYRITYEIEKEEVVDIICFCDGNLDELERTIDDWLLKASYHNYNFVICSNELINEKRLKKYGEKIKIHWINNLFEFNQYAFNSSCRHFVFWDTDNIITHQNWLKVLVSYVNVESIGIVGSNIINSENQGFTSGYVIANQHKIIPIRKRYIGMEDAPINRCIIGKTGYLVSREHFIAAGGFNINLSNDIVHFDLQIKVYNLFRRNIVVPQVSFMQRGTIGWEEVIPDLDSMTDFVNDPYYNPNFSKEIAYQL